MNAKQDVTRTKEMDQRFLLRGTTPPFCDPPHNTAPITPDIVQILAIDILIIFIF